MRITRSFCNWMTNKRKTRTSWRQKRHLFTYAKIIKQCQSTDQLLFPVIWSSAAYLVNRHGRTMITCDAWQKVLTFSEDIDLFPYILVCFMLCVWYAKHPTITFDFKALNVHLQICCQRLALTSIEQYWHNKWFVEFNSRIHLCIKHTRRHDKIICGECGYCVECGIR